MNSLCPNIVIFIDQITFGKSSSSWYSFSRNIWTPFARERNSLGYMTQYLSIWKSALVETHTAFAASTTQNLWELRQRCLSLPRKRKSSFIQHISTAEDEEVYMKMYMYMYTPSYMFLNQNLLRRNKILCDLNRTFLKQWVCFSNSFSSFSIVFASPRSRFLFTNQASFVYKILDSRLFFSSCNICNDELSCKLQTDSCSSSNVAQPSPSTWPSRNPLKPHRFTSSKRTQTSTASGARASSPRKISHPRSASTASTTAGWTGAALSRREWRVCTSRCWRQTCTVFASTRSAVESTFRVATSLRAKLWRSTTLRDIIASSFAREATECTELTRTSSSAAHPQESLPHSPMQPQRTPARMTIQSSNSPTKCMMSQIYFLSAQIVRNLSEQAVPRSEACSCWCRWWSCWRASRRQPCCSFTNCDIVCGASEYTQCWSATATPSTTNRSPTPTRRMTSSWMSCLEISACIRMCKDRQRNWKD